MTNTKARLTGAGLFLPLDDWVALFYNNTILSWEAAMSIRIATEQDLPAILAIYAPYVETTTTSFEYEAPSMDAFVARFRAINAQFPWLVWEEDGEILGYAYGSAPFTRAAYRWCAEPSIYLTPQAKGRGIGRKLYEALEAILLAQGYRKLYAIITSENRDSLAFHLALGYRHLADFPGCGYKFGRNLGITWVEKDLPFVERDSIPPIPWRDVVEIDKILR